MTVACAVQTDAFPGGEILGFIAVPEPASAALAGVALAGLGVLRRCRPAQA